MHELRRTKEKLHILMTSPNILWVLGDMIELTVEDLDDGGCTYSALDKIGLIKKLKEKYEMFIKDNEQPVSTQGKLGI